jgi:hypothetical protein
MNFVPRRDGSRKPFSFGKKSAPSTGDSYNESDPWGDGNSSNVTPQAPKKSFDPIKDRELKTRDSESRGVRDRAAKKAEARRTESNNMPTPRDSGSNYRNDID